MKHPICGGLVPRCGYSLMDDRNASIFHSSMIFLMSPATWLSLLSIHGCADLWLYDPILRFIRDRRAIRLGCSQSMRMWSSQSGQSCLQILQVVMFLSCMREYPSLIHIWYLEGVVLGCGIMISVISLLILLGHFPMLTAISSEVLSMHFIVYFNFCLPWSSSSGISIS